MITGLLFLTGCQDPFTLGADLLDEDQLKVDFTDTLSLRSKVIRGDTVLVYGPATNQRLNNFLFGDFEDPFFGKSISTIYAQVRLEQIKPDFSNSTLDSVVLVLPYDTSNVYGKIEEETFELEVRRLTEPMNNLQIYYSNASFATEMNPITTFDFVPSLDSIEVIEYVSNNVQDTESFPHLRVPLSQALGEELLGLDTIVTANDSTWVDYFRGLEIRPTKSTPGLLSFNLNTPFRGGIYLYYTQEDTIQRQYHFEINNASARLSSYQHDYTGAPAEAFIDDYEAGDSLVLLQGMAGLNTEIEIPVMNSEQFEDIIINKAELELTIKLPAENESLFPPIEQLLLSFRDANGTLQVIRDISLAANSGSGLSVFGGQYDEDAGTYTLNISTHLQEVLQNNGPYTLILSAFPKAENPERITLYGSGNPVEGIKLRIAFTKL